MRLTLRTLLAYLDDLLDPSDAVEMGKRIEENKIATELVHRIRTRMRLLRLGAPKVEGKGIGVDPNSVAEYLDNTLAPDRVLDFEKVCLESDVHLAEVASCHQILAAVLDKPATVEPALRQRMYNLIHLGGTVTSSGPPPVAPGYEDPLGPTVEPPLASPPPVASHTTSTDATSAPWKPLLLLAGSLAAVFLLVLGGLRAMGPFDGRHPIASLLGVGQREVAMGNGGESPESGNTTASREPQDSAGESQGGAGAQAAAGPAGKGAATDANAVGDASAKPENTGNPGNPEQAGNENAPAIEAVAVNRVEGGVGEPAPNGGRFVPDAPAAEASPKAGVAGAPARGLPQPGLAQPGLTDVVGGKPEARVAPVEKPAEASLELARFLSEEHIVCRRSSEDQLWYRLARGTRLLDGDHVVSLPVYRPQFVLSTGVQLMLVGEGSVHFKGLGDGEIPELAVDFGQLLLGSAGRPGSVVEVNLAGQPGTLKFVDVDAEVAVEVRRILPAGSDPAEVMPQVVISIATRRGRVGWLPEGGQELQIQNGQVCEFLMGEAPVARTAEFPDWASPPSMGGLDRQASEHLAGFVRLDRPVTLSLEELAEFRKTEVRSLAARCLGVLGQYEQLWRELGSDKQYSYWDEAVDALREGLARSPQDAAEIRKSLEDLRKRQADDLLRMLRGYDAQQLAQGGAAQLVDFLEHDDLDVRVLAFENLRRITESTHNYRPEKPAEARKVQIQEWRKQLKEGRIAYKMRRMG
ncbi:MAG: hypothetical protein U1A77_23955 [Pirellulales bacterium]